MEFIIGWLPQYLEDEDNRYLLEQSSLHQAVLQKLNEETTCDGAVKINLDCTQFINKIKTIKPYRLLNQAPIETNSVLGTRFCLDTAELLYNLKLE
jgi:hypothetical protein